MQLVLVFRIPLPMDSGSNLLFIIRVPYLLEKGGELLVPYLLEKGGGISHLGRQIIKVPRSQGLSVEEFLDNFFKSKKKYSCALHQEIRDLPLIKRRLSH